MTLPSAKQSTSTQQLDFAVVLPHTDDLKELCHFCLTKSPKAKQWSADQLLQNEIPRLYEIVTALQFDETSYQQPSLICERCESQMKMVAEIRLNFVRVAEFWKQHVRTDSTQIENVLKIQPACRSFEVALIKSETESSGDDFDSFGDEHRCVQLSTAADKDGQTVTSKVRVRRPVRELFESYKCEICGQITKTKVQIRRHIEYHHCKSKYEKCPICNKSNLKDLKSHINAHQHFKADTYSCSYCQRSFGRKAQMLQHQRQHTGDRPYICELCAFSFSSSSGLRSHQKFQHRNQYAENGFQAAGRPVQVYRNLPTLPVDRSVRIESTGKLTCPLCLDRFANRTSLRLHMRGTHPADYQAEYSRLLGVTCLICNVMFETAEQLADHKAEHYKHKCSICGRCFENRLTFDYHRKTHSTKERKYKCDECDLTFVRADHMKAHKKRTHSTLRPHVCALCQHGFVESYDLNMHLRRVHAAVRPHQCTECPKAYKTISLLRVHMAMHTGQQRYKCPVCDRPCHNGPLLSAHMKEFHPKESNTIL